MLANHSPVAIIRAAGKGERLKPYTDYYQKCILPINGKPLLVHWLDALDAQPMHIYNNIFYNYHSQQVISVVQAWERMRDGTFTFKSDEESFKGYIPGYEKGPNLEYVPTEQIDKDQVWQDTLHFYDLHSYLKYRPILFILADNYSPKLKKVLYDLLWYRDKLKDNICGIMALIEQKDCSSSTQSAIIDGSRHNLAVVREYNYGLNQGNILGLYAWAGIALFSPKALEMREVNTMPELFSLLAQQGKLLGNVINEPYWDIGSLAGYARAFARTYC